MKKENDFGFEGFQVMKWIVVVGKSSMEQLMVSSHQLDLNIMYFDVSKSDLGLEVVWVWNKVKFQSKNRSGLYRGPNPAGWVMTRRVWGGRKCRPVGRPVGSQSDASGTYRFVRFAPF